MNKSNCVNFDRCSAPICPLDKPELAVFYPGEDACGSREHGSNQKRWVRNQRKLNKKCTHESGYFTWEMINKMRGVSRRSPGLNPDARKNGLISSISATKQGQVEDNATDVYDCTTSGEIKF